MGQIYKRQTLEFQVLIWFMTVLLGFSAVVCAKSNKDESKVTVSPEVQTIVSKAAKKQDFSNELKQIQKMKEKPTPSLIAIFQDSNRIWQERWFAAMAMSKLPNDEVKQVLIRGSKDTLSIICAVSVQALAVFDEEDSRKAIEEAMNSTSLLVRDSAVKSIAKLKDRNAVDLLSKELFEKRNYYRGEPIFGIRENIIRALGEVGSMKGIDPLMKIFDQEKNPKMHNLACRSIEKIVGQDELDKKKAAKGQCPEYWQTWHKANASTAKK